MSKDNGKNGWKTLGQVLGGVAATAAVIGVAYADVESGAYDERLRRREAERRQREAEQKLAAERKASYMRECERTYDSGCLSVTAEVRFESKAIQNYNTSGLEPKSIFNNYQELSDCYDYISSVTELKHTSYGIFDDKSPSTILYYLRRAKNNW